MSPVLPAPPVRHVVAGLARLQRAFGETLRARVAGEDAAERGEDIWGKPGDAGSPRATPSGASTRTPLLAEPPLPLVARPGYATLVAGAVAILPPWAREALDLPLDRAAAALGRPLGRLGTAAARWGLAGVEDARRRSRAPGPDAGAALTGGPAPRPASAR